jgi:hypothetical protein
VLDRLPPKVKILTPSTALRAGSVFAKNAKTRVGHPLSQ